MLTGRGHVYAPRKQARRSSTECRAWHSQWSRFSARLTRCKVSRYSGDGKEDVVT